MVASPVVLDRQPVTQLLIEVAGCGILRQQMTLTVMKDENSRFLLPSSVRHRSAVPARDAEVGSVDPGHVNGLGKVRPGERR